MAAKPLSVAALKQMLTEQQAAHRSDGEIAQKLNDLELTEELTRPTLNRMMAEVKPGSQTAQGLELLADASTLLAPPASEIPALAPPDMTAQRALYSAAVNYVVKTLQHLPDFLATRETRSFSDSPGVVGHSGYAPVTPMHAVGTFQREITYRNGKEALEAEEAAAKKTAGPAGLATWGEFGPVLAIIMIDASKGRVTWSRWEDGASGRVAVFHFEVPKASSHYQVEFCCAWNGMNDVTGSAQPSLAYRGTPAYHGELYVDPASGAVLRVTLEAELGATEVIRRAAISVEYGPVEIGETRYVCPTRSLAISADMDRPGLTIGGAMPVTRINETLFTGYHRFGSTVRILTEVPKNLPAANAENADAQAGSNAGQSAGPPESAAPIAGNEAQTAAPQASPAPATTEGNAAAAPAGNRAQAPEVEAANNTTATESSPQAMPVFKTTARDVVLDVVVTKGNGNAVTGLDKKEFSVTENGRAQTVDFFEEHTANEATTQAPPEMPALPAGTVTNVPPAAAGDAVNVLLLDSLNTAPQDQANVHREILDFLKKMKPSTRIAIFALGSKLNFVQGFTTDSSVLLAALKQAEQGEKHGRTRSDAADEASDVSALEAMRASAFAVGALQAAQAQATSADLGARASMTFQALTYLADYLSGVPGRKNLLWFASSFPVVIFPSEEETKNIEKNPALRGTIARAKETADLFTSAQISIYPISAEGMMAEHFAEADSISPVTSPTGVGHIGNVRPDENMSPYSAAAGERAQVVNAMEQLAASTGGKAFYNTNDLNGAMDKAIDDGGNYYTIGYSPTDKTMDGSFRKIDVSVTRGKYKLAYRRGYNAEQTPTPGAGASVNPLTALLEYGLPGATGVLYGVAAKAGPTQEASPANRAGSNTALGGTVTRYRVDFTIRAADVELRPGSGGRRSGHILIGLKAYDRSGNAVNWEGDDETLEVKDAEYGELKTSGIPVHLMIDIPENLQGHLVTAVYDRNSGRAGTLEVPLNGEKQ